MAWKPQARRNEQNRREKRREYDKHRGSARERGYTTEWDKASKAFLVENPLCVECLKRGVATPATVTDHIIPHRGNMELFWDMTNWQSMCKPDHDRKTARGE